VSDQKLRKAVIRLAHAKPELRPELLPLLKKASSLDGPGPVFTPNERKLLERAKDMANQELSKYGDSNVDSELLIGFANVLSDALKWRFPRGAGLEDKYDYGTGRPSSLKEIASYVDDIASDAYMQGYGLGGRDKGLLKSLRDVARDVEKSL